MDYTKLLKRWAEEKENAIYIGLRDRQITYGQAYQDVCKFIVPEWKKQFPADYKTSVLIQTKNLYHQLQAFLAIMDAGQIPIIGHYDLPPDAENKLVLKNSIGFVLEEREDRWSLRQGVSPAKAPYQNACMGVLSSGSTDVPKVMYRTFESWAGFIPEQNRRFCINSDAVVFVEGSFSFTGNLSVWASVFYAGCTLAVSETFSCRQWLEMINAYHVSVLYLVPAKLKTLTRYLKRDYLSVKMILAGSQLLGARTAEKLKEFFPESEVILYYGASELNYITWLSYKEVLRFPDSVGKPVPGVKVWVEDGLIFIDTPYHVEGLQQPCTLHDTGYFNEEGYLIFNGREHDIINKGGFKISCTKIENTLCSLPGVDQATVLPYEDEERGQEAAAFVVCDAEISRQEVRLRLRQLLMPQEMPKTLIFIKEIPLNSRGKADKKALQAML